MKRGQAENSPVRMAHGGRRVVLSVVLAAGMFGAVRAEKISNEFVEVAFDRQEGTFSVRDRSTGEVVLDRATIGATTRVRGGHWSFAVRAVTNRVFGSGTRLTATVRDDSIGARWGFSDADYQYPGSMNGSQPLYTYTLYAGHPALIMGFGVKAPKWYRCRFREATVLLGGRWLPGQAIAQARTINSAAGAEPAHLKDGLTRLSANGLVWTGLANGRRRTLVAGGLGYDAFGKYAELVDGSLTLTANDPVGVLLDIPCERLFEGDTFYLDCVTRDPFAAAERYGRAMRTVNNCSPNVYDFPLLCGWAVGALSHLGNINTSAKLVEELDIANAKGYCRYCKVGVRLEPDTYCYRHNGNTEQGWYDDAHWSRFGHLVKPYDTFAKWCAAVTARNGIPYTYIQVGMPSHDFERQHKDWMLFNTDAGTERQHRHHQPFVSYDFTDAGLVEHYRQTWARLRRDGMRGIKFDYPETGYRPEGGFDDVRMSAVQVYRAYFRLAKEGLGPESFLDERNLGESGRPCLDATAGTVDTQRTWTDSNKFDSRMITTDGLRWFKMRTVFNYYPDAKAVHGLPEGVRRALLTTVYLTSGRIELATSFRLFTPQMVRELSRLYPEYREPWSARPIDAFLPGTVNPRVYDLELTPDEHRVMLFNPDRHPAAVGTALGGDRAGDGALGLEPSAQWHVFAFWDDAYAGLLGATDRIEMNLAAQNCEIFRVTKARGRPQVVSTTRHVLQGWMDVKGETWDAAKRTLTAEATCIPDGDEETVTVAAFGPGGRTVYPVVSATVPYAVTNGLVRLRLKGSGRFTVRFGEPVSGPGAVPTRFGAPRSLPPDPKQVKLPPKPPKPTVFAETLTPLAARTGWGNGIRRGRSYNGPITLGREVFAHGIAIHANGHATYRRDPKWKRFVAVCGVDESQRRHRQSSVVFRVIAEHPGGESDLAVSPVITFGGIERWHFNCKIPDGVTAIRLESGDADDGDKSDHGNWADCGFLMK